MRDWCYGSCATYDCWYSWRCPSTTSRLCTKSSSVDHVSCPSNSSFGGTIHSPNWSLHRIDRGREAPSMPVTVWACAGRVVRSCRPSRSLLAFCSTLGFFSRSVPSRSVLLCGVQLKNDFLAVLFGLEFFGRLTASKQHHSWLKLGILGKRSDGKTNSKMVAINADVFRCRQDEQRKKR